MESFREPINSKTLQEKFPEVYLDYFGRNNLIGSACIDVQFLHDNNTRFRGVAIKQKIPLKVYCGIRTAGSQRDHVFQYIDHKTKKLVKKPMGEVLPEFQKALTTLEEQLSISSPVCIEVFSEAGRGMGFGVTSKIAALLPYLLINYTKIDSISVDSLKNNKDLLKLSSGFCAILRKGDVDYSGICSAFSHSSLPDYTVYGKPITHIRDMRTPLDIKYISYGNIQDIISTQEIEHRYDFYFIYTGQENPIISFSDLHEKDEKDINRPLKHLDHNNKKQIYQLTPNIYLDYLKILYDLSYYFLDDMITFFEDPYHIKHFEDALRTLNRYATIKEYIETEQTESMELVHQIRNILSSHRVKNFGVIRTGSYRLGGGISIITEKEKAREVMSDAIHELQEKFPFIEVPYISFIDGFSSQGVMIEKWDKEEVWSSFDKTNHLFLHDWEGNKQLLEKLAPEELDYDVILDMVQNKIIIGKKYLTSKELHSQRMTLDILRALLFRLDQEVPNNELSVSSYSQNKNEMQGKIIIPLTKLILDKTGKKISLTCKGSNIKFYLKLGKSDLKLGYIQSH